MPRWWALLLSVLLVGIGPGSARAAAPALALDVSVAGGARLGRLVGEPVNRVAYFALEDVARLAGGTVRRWPDGTRASVVARRGLLEVRRDSPTVSVDGQGVTLAAPVRVRRGAWRVPGDLLVRALPTLVGAGIHLAPASASVSAAGRPAGPAGLGPAARPAPPPASALPGVVPAVLRPPPVETPRREAPARGEPGESRAPAEAAIPEAPGVELRAGGLEVRVRSYPRFTRLVLEGPSGLAPRLVDSGEDLLIALPGLGGRPPAGTRAVRDGLVGTLEFTALRAAPALRVSFDHPPVARKVYRLDDPFRVVLDFHRETPGPGPLARGTASVALRTIALDAGHGGHDSGAIGPTGLQEKELTLDLVQRVGALIQEELGVRVVLTRSRDQFVALRERTALANREQADLFVSIHANAAPAAAATGTETYFLSTEATDGAARQAAARENRVIALEGAPRGSGPRDVLRTILWDLAQAEFQQESSRLAEALQGQLDRALRRPSRGVKQAPFYVLGGAAMPAVLVEVGFITNSQDEQRLRDDGYRDRLARALGAGLAAYKRSWELRTGLVARR
jgi:N-acetylmuramoyl-L-alanine amidase